MIPKTVLSYVWFSWRMSGGSEEEPFFGMSRCKIIKVKVLLNPGSCLRLILDD
jgi:hypothetical protein